MENLNIEKNSEEVIEIKKSDEQMLHNAAQLISEYSWGLEYPINPIDEVLSADYCVGVVMHNKLIGFGSVGRTFSPDSLDHGELWVAHAVVAPEFRGKGVLSKLYDKQLAYAKSQQGRILSCTNNPIAEKFLLKNGWNEVRNTLDEGGEVTTVFEYDRNYKNLNNFNETK